MTRVTLLAALLLASGCGSMRDHPWATGIAPGSEQVVLVQGSDDFFWDGWHASQKELPNLVSQYHPRTVILTAQKGFVVDFSEVRKLREAVISAGVDDVRIGSGGMTGQ